MTSEPVLNDAQLAQLGLHRESLPRHVAVIMDGNGRWAERRGLPRIEGHRNGVASVRRITEQCARLGLEQLTLYCLSSENWKRPEHELGFLMHLLEQYMIEERGEIMRQDIRVGMIGRRDGIPPSAAREIDKTIELTRDNGGTYLCLAVNYGARQELADAARRIAREVRDGALAVDDVDEETLAARLYTAGRPDPDLLVRTAGERRVSNYLLWQISYAEIWVTDVCWPDFDAAHLHDALRDYAQRNRRFGGLPVAEPTL